MQVVEQRLFPNKKLFITDGDTVQAPASYAIYVVGRISNGDRVSEIAESIYMSERTLEHHIALLREQFDCKNIAHLCSTFIRKGWIK